MKRGFNVAREKLEPYEKANLRGSPKTADQAFTMFQRLCARQKTTPIFLRKTKRGNVFTLAEFPTFRACFRTVKAPEGKGA